MESWVWLLGYGELCQSLERKGGSHRGLGEGVQQGRVGLAVTMAKFRTMRPGRRSLVGRAWAPHAYVNLAQLFPQRAIWLHTARPPPAEQKAESSHLYPWLWSSAAGFMEVLEVSTSTSCRGTRTSPLLCITSNLGTSSQL